jgi:hypothetical protein
MDSAGDLPKGGVSPFGHPRINDRSHLPAAFRSVPRPSSPLGAKASTGRPYHAPARTPAHNQQQQPTNATYEQNQTPPPPTPTKAAAAKTANGRTDGQTDGWRRTPFTQHIQSRFNCERTSRRRRPGKDRQGQRQRQTVPEADPQRQALAGILEAIGFEPTTPCLQSRCSPN